MNRQLTTINNNKRTLLKSAGYKSINEARTYFEGFTDLEIYNTLLTQYNDIVIFLQEERLRAMQKAKEIARKAKKDAKLKAKKEAFKLVKNRIVIIDLEFQSVKKPALTEDDVAEEFEKQIQSEIDGTIYKPKEMKPNYFTFVEQIKMETRKPKRYFDNQIKKANDELIPAYQAFVKDNKIPELELKDIFNELSSVILKAISGSGISAVYILNHKITEVQIGTPESILLNPIKEAGSMNLDGLILNEVWCKDKGTCVPDWLTYKYSKTKGHIKSVKSYEEIERLSTYENECLKYSNKPNTNGYTIKNIELFCNNTNKTLIVLHNAKIIIYKQVSKCEDPLVIEIKNNHLYPITDNKKIRSLAHIGSSSSFHIHKEKAQTIYDKIEYIQQEGNATDFILDTMAKLNLQTYDQKIVITNGHLNNFHLNKTLYSTSPYDESVEKLCKKQNIAYQGQPALSFLPPFIKKLPSTFMNEEIRDALVREGVKHRTHYGAFNESEDPFVSCDINKCYRFIMENPMDNFMTLDFNSYIEKSSFKNEFGLYYVKTTDMTILHGSNWYSNNILKMAYDNNVMFATKYFIKGIPQDKNILKNIIDEMKDAFSPEITKTLINSISGFLGKTETNQYILQVDNDINRVWESIPKNVNDFFFKEQNGTYLYGKKSTKQLLENNLPMYIQILDWANMLMSKYILELGGFDNLLYRKTDAFIMKDVGIKPNFSDEIGGYKYNPPPVFMKGTVIRSVDYNYDPAKWNMLDVKNSDDYEKINTHLQSNSVMISARAGTGKSFVINKIDAMNKCIKLAFTNKASLNIKGQTIHKFLGIDDNNKCSLDFVLNKLKDIDIVILDEMSMIDKALWKILYEIKYMTGIRFLLCGDYRQLPPVEDDNIDYFNHSSIMYMCDGYRCELQFFEKCRYNKELYDYLEDVWEERPITINVAKVMNGSHICFTNKKRKEINAMNNKKGELISYTGTPNKYNEDIRIAVGVPLVCLVANKKLEIVKNELVSITKIDDKHIYFDEKFIEKNDIHKYFMLGYAMTIHKSQGDTIDGIVNIHEISAILQNKRMFYTAVSRATSLANVNYVN